ncbi:hypothetical protein SRB5_32390 [Streptomyces sp. RB5]|uniref:DUF461 domain-containing protein n=1 Tax=Streptomyces smaragdinus TaxID=2585196 RepID=A0A7K0CI02_9ACTN|nr:DUF461 domain-containing protein [Streptomyces smaragdinus]MQY13098.1 hypothetical protein [Streptomyces smaragdinus]
MSRSLRRGILAAASLFLPLALSACAAGNHAATGQIKPDNAAVTQGDIQIQNGLVITSGEGAGQQASVSARIFNNSTRPETLSEVTLEKGTKVLLRAPDGATTVTVPAQGSVMLGGEGNASAALESIPEGLMDGNAKKVVFRFSDTGAVTMRAAVRSASGTYKDFGPSAPAPGATGAAPTPTSTEYAADTEPAAGSATPGGSESPATPGTEDAAQPGVSPSASTD